MFHNFVLVFAIKQYESVTGIHICPLLEPPSYSPPQPTPLGWHRALSWAPSIIQQIPTDSLFYTRERICRNATLSICPTLSFPLYVHSLFSMSVSLCTLQIGSSVPLFYTPYICINTQYLFFLFLTYFTMCNWL